jgi:hypothetical protein
MSDHAEALDYLLAVAHKGASVPDVQTAIERLLASDPTDSDMADWRLRRGKLKKVCDEILPVVRLLKFLGENGGSLQFPLNNKVPDCFWCAQPGDSPTGIEVTISQGRARHILGTELVGAPRGRVVRGFLELQDDAPKKKVEAARKSRRTMYSTQQALEAARSGISRSLRAKNHVKYRGMVLVIEAPLESLPSERWKALEPLLRGIAEPLPFRSVFVLGHGERLPAMQLK